METQTFGQLTAIGPKRSGRHGSELLCRCACGAERWFRKDKLPFRKSCGCVAAARTTDRPPCLPPVSRRFIKPSERATHSSWCAMLKRCAGNGGGTKGAKYYAGRGVSVHQRWLSFDAFVADLGLRPSMEHSLDRYPNQVGNYEPGNVRWATQIEQQRNRTNNLLVEFRGTKITCSELVDHASPGVTRAMVYGRVRRGWQPERAISITRGGRDSG